MAALPKVLPSKLKPPPGFDALDVRKKVAEKLRLMIDAVKSDPIRLARLRRMDLAAEVYDDEQVLSSIDLEDVTPYQVQLIEPRVTAMVSRAFGSIDDADPNFQLTGGDEMIRERAEKDLQYALEKSQFNAALRIAGKEACLRCRGPFRVTYQTVKKDQGWHALAGQSQPGEDTVYSGLVFDPIEMGDTPQGNPNFVWYPTHVRQLEDCRLIAHRFELTIWQIMQRQDRGEYFDDVDIELFHDQESFVEGWEDDSPDLYSGVAWLPEGGAYLDSGATGDARAAVAKIKPYRFTLAYDQQELLKLTPYTEVRPEYFAPGLWYEAHDFLSKNSLASKMIETQTIYNDSYTVQIAGNVASAFLTALATGGMGDIETFPTGVGRVIFMRGNPQITVMPSRFTGGTLPQIAADMRDSADAQSRIATTGLGMLPEASQTATATSGAMAGQAEGVRDAIKAVDIELRKAMLYCLELLAANWTAFSYYNAGALMCQSAADLIGPYDVKRNVTSMNNSPEAVTAALEMVLGTAERLEIPIMPGTKVLVGDELFQVALNASGLPANTEKVLIDIGPALEATAPFQEQGLGGLPLPGDLTGGIPPELLVGGAGFGQGEIPEGGFGEMEMGAPVPALGP